MKLHNHRKCIFFLLTLILFAIQVLGASNFVQASNEEVKLKAVAQKYWNSKLTGDVITCYQLETPTYQKKTPLSIYAKEGNLVFKEVKIKKVEISDDKGKVIVEVRYIIPAFGTKHVFPSTVKDQWIKLDGKWYHVMKNDKPIG